MQILLVGDPHPENYGTYLRDDGVLAMTFNDFDAARYGPYLLDPWRLAVGFEVLARSLGPLDGPDGRLAQEVARGYAAQVLAEVDGGKAELEVAEGGEILAQCVICADLLRRARRDGEALEILDFYTALEGDTRTLKADTFAPIMLTPEVIDDDLEPVSTEELAVIIDILAKNAHVNGLKPVAVKGNGIARLLGKGVSSYPLLRYVVLLEGPTTAASDDILLDIKEAVDSPDITGLLQWPPRIWSCHGERIVEAQRRLQGETWDVLAGWAEVGRGSFVVQGMSGYQKSARVDRIAEKVREGEWTRGDVEVFARVAGRLLGSAHVRSHRLGGEGAGALIAGVLRGKEEAFSEEVTRFAMDYGDIVVRDWERLVQLRAAYGPWLGARRGSQVVWRGQ